VGLVLLIDRPGYRLATDRKVLKHSEACVIEEITQAYVRARGEINTALGNLEKACTQATEDAYRKGLAKAEREAAQRWTQVEVERLVLLRSLQPALASLIVDALGLLAKDIDREAFMARALDTLRGPLQRAGPARLRVNPAAVHTAEAALIDFTQRTGLGKLARVVSDDSLPEEGCVLESDLGKVDVSLGTQLEAINGAIAAAARLATGVPADPEPGV
jgi:flagellar biosynthesis/type III secretory pathway protein FliH